MKLSCYMLLGSATSAFRSTTISGASLEAPRSSPIWALSDDQPSTPKENSENEEHFQQRNRFPALESPMYDEKRPRRIHAGREWERRRVEHNLNDWGVERHTPAPIQFPSTVEDVTEEAFRAIAGTLYSKQAADPNIVQNVLQGDTLHGRRPVRTSSDNGRIGIEIDGARYLFSRSKLTHPYDKHNGVANAVAIRRVALRLAEKLAASPWDGFEGKKGTGSGRPVILYFNQIEQALAASNELILLKRNAVHSGSKDAFDNITIKSLADGISIPKEMFGKSRESKKPYKDKRVGRGVVDPSRGILMVVQPTDFNDEYSPPGPAVGSLESFQRLSAVASLHEIPVICLSPRFLTSKDPSVTSYEPAPWDQSGYQQSATYGGLEPPRGPTPWILRDFSPPVFCWVGNALPLRDTEATSTRLSKNDSEQEYFYSEIALMQSVMNPGHSWHMFASKQPVRALAKHENQSSTAMVRYEYLASTKSASGRPTKEVVRRLFQEFESYE